MNRYEGCFEASFADKISNASGALLREARPRAGYCPKKGIVSPGREESDLSGPQNKLTREEAKGRRKRRASFAEAI